MHVAVCAGAYNMNMQHPCGPKKSKSKQMALGGIFCALAILLMLMGGILPIATFTAPVFASLCLLPILIEMGVKTALLCYGAISLLSFMLVPDREAALFFVLLTGYYPILQPYFLKIRNRVLRILAKLLLFNLAVAAIYALLLLLFAPALQQDFAQHAVWFWGILLLLGNFTFLLYDILIDRVKFAYCCKVRPRLFRK